MHPRKSGQGIFPRYGGGWMHQFGYVYALQQELLNSESKNWFRAVELWHTARYEGVAMNSSHFTNILRQCVTPAAWEQALSVLNQMKRESIRPDVVGIGCAMAACASAKKKDAVEKIFTEYQKKSMLDSVCYLALIKARVEAGEWREALEIGTVQSKNGIPFLPYTYSHLLEAANRADDWAYAHVLVRNLRMEKWPLPEEGRKAWLELCSRHDAESDLDKLDLCSKGMMIE